VLFGFFPDDEGLERLVLGKTKGGDGGDDGVGAQGKAADGPDRAAGQGRQDEFGGEESALGGEGDGAAVNIIVAGSAGRENDILPGIGVPAQDGEQALALGGGFGNIYPLTLTLSPKGERGERFSGSKKFDGHRSGRS
jgi:hypothetical protein